MIKLNPGDKTPKFTLTDQDDNKVKLTDYRGQKILGYFFPRADTPGCTRQACSVSESLKTLQKQGVQPLGISPDTPEKQKKFDQKYSLGFPLLSDPDNAAAQAYGAWGEKKRYGRTYEGIIRSAFLIDEKGTLLQAWYNVKPEDTVPKALAALEAHSR